MVGALQIDACVSGWSVSLLVMGPWFNTFESFIGLNVRSACIYLFSTTAYVNGPFLHLDISSRYAALFAGVHIRKNH